MHLVLEPLGYHQQVASRLKELEPASWAACADLPGGVPDLAHEPAAARAGGEELHRVLARTARRLEGDAHPGVADAVRRAAAALEIDVPIGVHQLQRDTPATATLHHLPDQVVITLGGNLLDLLTDDELCAVLGHELAHRLLWTAQDGDYLVADRLLGASALDARTAEAVLETARRWGLATELYADRGALRACGDLAVAVGALAKVSSGLSVVDVDGYLRQAEAADPEPGCLRGTHPEIVPRVWALDRWRTEESDRAAHLLLRPELDFDRLDLIDQQALQARTRAVIGEAVRLPELATAPVLAQARQFFPDLDAPDPDAPEPGPPPQAAPVAGSTRRYLAYVLLDLAAADPETGDDAVPAALRLAARHGLGAELYEAVQREGLAGRRIAGRLAEAAGIAAGAA